MFSFAEITTRCKEYNWPQTANITHHKKLPLNEKAPCQTSSSSISITPFSFSVSTAFASYRSVTERGLLWQFEHSVSISSACRQQRWVCTPLPQSLLHSVSFSRCVSSHRTVALLHIKQAKWGHAFIRQELWVYPSLSYIVEERRCCCTVAFWHSLSHGAIEFFPLFLCSKSYSKFNWEKLSATHLKLLPPERELQCTEAVTMHRSLVQIL